ncbi:hypothetical protein AgCh_036768 [Apium graveolens]
MSDPTKFGFRRRSNPFVVQGSKQVEPVVWILDSGSSKYMTGDRALLSNVMLGEDTDPKAICQWSVSTSPGLNPLDAYADSGSDIDSSDEFNKDGDLRTPIAPPVTSLRMAKTYGGIVNFGCNTWNTEMEVVNQVTELDNLDLENEIIAGKVKNAVFSMHPEKSPGT